MLVNKVVTEREVMQTITEETININLTVDQAKLLTALLGGVNGSGPVVRGLHMKSDLIIPLFSALDKSLAGNVFSGETRRKLSQGLGFDQPGDY